MHKKILVIKQVQYDDMGIYICKGINGYGTADSKIELFVMGMYKIINYPNNNALFFI